jgi:Zn-dependent M28 family amino/carboxypeptidase
MAAAAPPTVDRDALEQAIRHLGSFERGSASPGERQAAEWLAGELCALGLEAELEEHPAHGGYWWPLGLLNLLALGGGLAALRGRRWLGAVAGAAASAAIYDDVHAVRQWFRRPLRRKRTWNVMAEAGDPAGMRTVVVVGHHDAAHSGLLFHPGILPFFAKLAPGLHEKATTSPPAMWGAIAGPVLVAIGSALRLRKLVRAGVVVSGGAMAVMADIGSRGVVAGANDNLSGSATVLGVARSLREQPVEGVRVLLVSCGSEESFEEGMLGFARRHFASLPRETTEFIVVDTVGSPTLTLPECEGMIVHKPYDERLKDLLTDSARSQGIEVRRGLKFSFSSDAAVPLNHGYRACMLGSVTDFKAPSNYHWPTDVPDNVDFDQVAKAVQIVDGAIRRIAAGE